MEQENLNFATLFIFRFVLDKPNDIVNLHEDIQDLYFYPERLHGSYKQEWMTYVKKRAHELNYALTNDKAEELFKKLPAEKKQKFYELSEIIEKAEQINQSENINVIKTDVKAYIEQLLKL